MVCFESETGPARIARLEFTDRGTIEITGIVRTTSNQSVADQTVTGTLRLPLKPAAGVISASLWV